VVKEISYPRLPTLRGKQKAKGINVPIWSDDFLELDKSMIGLNGSPTRVVKIEVPKVTRRGKILTVKDEETALQAINELVDFLTTKELI